MNAFYDITRYSGEIGDVVVGRVKELASKKWIIDANGRVDSVLLLSSISLPGGVQRRKTEYDELNMRAFFSEGDCLVAEVQTLYSSDASLGLHTRNLKYGKLTTGCFLSVNPSLIKRSKSHFHILRSCGVEVILGLNGYVWIGNPRITDEDSHPDLSSIYSNHSEEISKEMRLKIVRVRKIISILDENFIFIVEENINNLYLLSIKHFEDVNSISSSKLMELASSLKYD